MIRTLVFCSAINVFAVEAVRSPIELAQEAILRKDRQSACAILQKSLLSLPAPLKLRVRTMDSLQQLSQVFLTDKGQKLFESAHSMAQESPDVAMSVLTQALALEDNNILILNQMARLQIIRNEWSKAEETLNLARTINPYSADSGLLELEMMASQKKWEGFREKAKTLSSLDKRQESQLKLLLAEDYFVQGSFKKTLELLERLPADSVAFPEGYYYIYKSYLSIGKSAEPWLSRYISKCQAWDATERKRNLLSMRFCQNLKEAENDFAKTK